MSVEGAVWLRLSAADLASKWGFNDGDMPVEIWDALSERGFDVQEIDWHHVLRSLVCEHLLPMLPGVEVYEVETMHNPIRTDHWVHPNGESGDIEVLVPLDAVIGAVQGAGE